MSEGPCSACGRTKTQATRFHPARPGGNAALSLCNHCVAECGPVIDDSPTRIPGGAHHCDFCGKDEGNVAILVAVGARKVCDECVDAYGAAS